MLPCKICSLTQKHDHLLIKSATYTIYKFLVLLEHSDILVAHLQETGLVHAGKRQPPMQ